MQAPSNQGEGFMSVVFTLKTHLMFPVHTKPQKFENVTITSHFGFIMRKTRAGK